jgi:uncharacterized paraquat-inducible protein A
MNNHHEHGKRQGGRHRNGDNGYCVCPQCGYSVAHRAGVPCRTLACPTCKTTLVRSETSSLENQNN